MLDSVGPLDTLEEGFPDRKTQIQTDKCLTARGKLLLSEMKCTGLVYYPIKYVESPKYTCDVIYEKSRIRETPTLSTDADSRTDTNLKRKRLGFFFYSSPPPRGF